MGKASSSKKVARAAGTGGGRTSRGTTPTSWYLTLFVVIALGLGITVFSRQERVEELAGSDDTVAPRTGGEDHWHVAMGVYVCDRWFDPITDQSDPKGIHTHGDGIIHVHPTVRSAAGRNAVLARYAEAVGGSLDETEVTWIDGATKVTKKNGATCGQTPGQWKFAVDGKDYVGDPDDIRFTDRGKVVLAFVPKDRAITGEGGLGDPPSTPGLDNLTDVAPTNPEPSVPPGDVTATTGAATSVPADPGATTTAPAGSATTAPAATTASTTPTSAPATTAAP